MRLARTVVAAREARVREFFAAGMDIEAANDKLAAEWQGMKMSPVRLAEIEAEIKDGLAAGKVIAKNVDSLPVVQAANPLPRKAPAMEPATASAPAAPVNAPPAPNAIKALRCQYGERYAMADAPHLTGKFAGEDMGLSTFRTDNGLTLKVMPTDWVIPLS